MFGRVVGSIVDCGICCRFSEDVLSENLCPSPTR